MSCPDCIKGNLLPGDPAGTLNPDGSYLANAPEGQSSNAVLILTDIFGLPVKNPKLIADNISKALSCDVWVPDIFAGLPPVHPGDLRIPERAGQKMSLRDYFSFIYILLFRLPRFIRSRPSVVDARLAEFVTKLKAEKKYHKIGAVGYCFGGSAAIRLGATDLVDSVVICHPGGFSNAQLAAIKVPAAWVCAEDDFTFSLKKRLATEACFKARKGKKNEVEYEFTDYKGTAHGFATRPNLSIPEVKEGYEKSLGQTIQWFRKTLF